MKPLIFAESNNEIRADNTCYLQVSEIVGPTQGVILLRHEDKVIRRYSNVTVFQFKVVGTQLKRFSFNGDNDRGERCNLHYDYEQAKDLP